MEPNLLQDYSPLIGIFAALAMGTVSPGPSFLFVARTSVSCSRGAGLLAAMGMGAGGVVFATAALLGLHALLLTVPSLYVGLKVLGGVYLAYLGLTMWLAGVSAPSDLAPLPRQRMNGPRSFAVSVATQVSNPKAAIVYASVFAAFLPPVTTITFNLVVIGLVFVLEAGWYAVVALALSSPGPRRAYLRYKIWLDRLAGSVMMALGIKLIASARTA